MQIGPRQQDESGFTLIELLIATVVLGMLSSAVGACIILFFKTADGTGRRFDYSHDSQLLATYLTPDLESLGTTPGWPTVIRGKTSRTRGKTSSCPALSSSFSDLEIDFSNGASQYVVHYTVIGSVITRTFKATGATPSQSTTLVVHNLKRPDLACFSNGPVAPWTWTMTVTTGSPTGTNPSDDYTFSVTAGGRVTYPPPTPPTLLPEDDSSNGLNITKETKPTFSGNALPGDIVTLFAGQSQVGRSAPVGPLGTYSVDVKPNPLAPDGNFSMTATATDKAGDTSVPSAPTTVTIDTFEAPPSTLVLDPASESGPKGDNITNVNTPSFKGSAENNLNSASATVTLFDRGRVVGAGTSKDGSYTATVSSATPLGKGSHRITAQTTDAANNKSQDSPLLIITVDTAAPTIDSPITTGSGGTGTATGALGTENDDLPAATFAIYLGNSTTGPKVQSGQVLTNGVTWSVSWTGLTPPTQYTIVVTQTDQAGNVGSHEQAFTEP